MKQPGEQFYGRKEELDFFAKRWDTLSKGELIILYGRRRLGKTRLAKKFMDSIGGKSKKLYLFVNAQEESQIKEDFSKDILEQTGDTLKIVDWKDLFDYLAIEAGKGKLCVVIDEFQRTKVTAPAFITQLQNQWDSRLKNERIMLLLVGSSIGMMTKIALAGTGALYGRKTGQMQLQPFTYADFRRMFHDLGEEKKVEWFAVFGGTPYYLELAKAGGHELPKAIETVVLGNAAPLRDEPKNLLEFELRNIARYNSILHAIAAGKQTVKEIADVVGVKQSSLPAYLSSLDRLLGLVGKKDPMFGRKNAGRYALKDNFFRFWYRFVLSQSSLLELGRADKALETITGQLDSYVGREYERVAIELFKACNGGKIRDLELDFAKIGSWWDKRGNEIDIAFENRGELVLGEVKWTADLVGVEVLENLMKKAQLVNRPGRRRFVLVSKNGFTRGCLERARETNTLTLDLKDIQKLYDSKR
mgnify:CR=1 FL=1